MNIIVEIKGLEPLIEKLEKIDEIYKAAVKLRSEKLPEWVSYRKACELKGIDPKTSANQPWMQPPESEKRHVGGSREWKWPRVVILEWLTKTVEELKAKWRRRLRVA